MNRKRVCNVWSVSLLRKDRKYAGWFPNSIWGRVTKGRRVHVSTDFRPWLVFYSVHCV